MKYLSGFGSHFSTEAAEGALPKNQNNPQQVPLGLYAEQLSGSAFTAPRTENARTWLYRIRPSAGHPAFNPKKLANFEPASEIQPPNQMRWDPLPIPTKPTSFLEGMRTICSAGSPRTQAGLSVHLYAFNQSMTDQFFYSADGEWMFVPQQGELILKTEMGHLELAPLEIAVVPRGVKFQIELKSDSARGYVCENWGQRFRLPDRGPIGGNSLADERHFLSPAAKFEERPGKFELITQFQGRFWSTEIDHSPLNVVAWHGNYAPYKYDLRLFNTIGTVSFDHPDPSIFTVLTSSSDHPGTANCDFVIFPPRWMVADHTFRPPYFHRNIMSEYMGLIEGVYDAKEKGGFVPGGGSLHNCMQAHGPDAEVVGKASGAELKPMKQEGTMAFMFETRYPYQVTPFALDGGLLQKDYQNCWSGLKSHFKSK